MGHNSLMVLIPAGEKRETGVNDEETMCGEAIVDWLAWGPSSSYQQLGILQTRKGPGSLFHVTCHLWHLSGRLWAP